MSSTWNRLRRNRALQNSQPYHLEDGNDDDENNDEVDNNSVFGRASSSRRRSPLPRRQGSFSNEPIIETTTAACSSPPRRSRLTSSSDDDDDHNNNNNNKKGQSNNKITPKELLAAAFAIHKETLQSLRHTERMLEASHDMGQQTALQLQQQQDMVHEIDAILDERGEFSRLLKRASLDIKSIARRMMRDKIFICLCCTVLWMLIVVVILAIRGAITGASLPKFRSSSSA